MSLKKLLMFGALAFGLFFLVEAPGEAARLVKATGESAGEWFETVASSLAQFVKTLV
jgi:hypothetical protein